MRPLLLLLPLLLGAAPFDPEAIVVRDGLLADDYGPPYSPSYERTFAAELDGAPPLEQVVVTIHPVPEAAAQTAVHPYRWTGEAWAPLPSLSCGGYMESGYVEPIDLDGDGQHELLLVGDTDGHVPADLSVVRLTDGAFVDLVWGADPGAAYAVGDVDADGTAEVIAMPSTPGPFSVLGLADDGHLRVRPAPDAAAWLPGVLDAALDAPAQHRLEGLAAVMAHVGAAPNPAAVPTLQARWDELSSYERAPLVTLLDAGGAHAFLTSRLAAWNEDDPHRALGRLLATSRPDAVVAAAIDALGTIAGRELLEGALPVFAARSDPRLRDLVASAIRDPATSEGQRGDLVFWVLPHDVALAPVLLEVLDRKESTELLRLAASTAERTAGRFTQADPNPWRVALDVGVAQRLFDHVSPHVRAAGLHLLIAHEAPPSADVLVERLLSEPDAMVRRHLVGALPKGGPAAADSPALQLLGAEPYVRRGVHWWIAHGYDVDRWLEGLAHVQSDDDLEPYAIALRRDPPRRDPVWAPVGARAVAWARHEHPRMRQRTCEVLGALPSEATRAALIALLRDPVDYVRTTAAEHLARHQDDATVDPLLAGLERAEGSYERGQFLKALGQTQQPRSLALLADLLADPESGARFALQEAGPVAAPAFISALETRTDCSARRLLTSLARVDPEAAVARLPGVRAILCEEPDADWLPWLIESFERANALEPVTALTEHPERRVRIAALEARGRLLRQFAKPRID